MLRLASALAAPAATDRLRRRSSMAAYAEGQEAIIVRVPQLAATLASNPLAALRGPGGHWRVMSLLSSHGEEIHILCRSEQHETGGG